MKVLVKEQIAESGIDLLREQFDVELGFEMTNLHSTNSLMNNEFLFERPADSRDGSS